MKQETRLKLKYKKILILELITKEKIKFNGVKITMIGPTSEMTSEITLEEAIQLHKCLGEYLKN